MDTSEARAPSDSEGDGNKSPRRKEWKARNLDDATRALVDADSRYFFHQSLSTPCISAIRKAEGIWLEDMAGRRFMDFHGNNVHHIGYGHPRLVEALKRQIDDLPFTPGVSPTPRRWPWRKSWPASRPAASPRCCSRPAAPTPSRWR